ncbi:MAG: alpha-L-fucosidase [Caldilineaceae bacterium]
MSKSLSEATGHASRFTLYVSRLTFHATNRASMIYQPTYESVSRHPVPNWFHDAKLGIFIHWGLYSVPAYAPNSGELSEILASGEWAKWFANNPYAEWYMNSYRIDGSPTQHYHRDSYGADFDYKDFVPLFNAAIQAWQPDEWATLKQVNARYVVLTTKHHDGFLMWPSETPNPHLPDYHASRDLVGELGDAVRRRFAHGLLLLRRDRLDLQSASGATHHRSASCPKCKRMWTMPTPTGADDRLRHQYPLE